MADAVIHLDMHQPLAHQAGKGHNRWHPDIPPKLRVASGSTVEIDVLDGVDGQIRAGMPVRPDGRAESEHLTLAARNALINMIDYVVDAKGFTREQAYALASVAVDLRVSQVVDVPNMTVSAFLPLDIFASQVGAAAASQRVPARSPPRPSSASASSSARRKVGLSGRSSAARR